MNGPAERRLRAGLQAPLWVLLCAHSVWAAPPGAQLLRQNWVIQSSSDVREGGAVLSTAEFKPTGWYPATLPSTVFSALVEGKVYPDPYFGSNLAAGGGDDVSD